MKVQIIKRFFTGTGLSIHVEPVAWVALAVEGARGADAGVLAAMLPVHTHVHSCKTEWASEWPTGTPDIWGAWLWHMSCPCSRSQRDNSHSPSPASSSAHPLISSAQTLTLCSALYWHFIGEAASPSTLLLAQTAAPNTPLTWVRSRHQPPPLPLHSSSSHPPQSLSWNCLANCWMSSKDSTRKTCSSSGGEAMARREFMSARWIPTA